MVSNAFSSAGQLSKAQQDYNLVREVYGHHRHEPEAMRSLVFHFLKTHMNDLRLVDDAQAVERFFSQPEKAVLIEKPYPRSPAGKFDAERAFSAKIERGGNQGLAEILGKLDSIDLPHTGAPVAEAEVQRANRKADEKLQATHKAFAEALRLFQQETTNALLSDRHEMGRSPGLDAAYRWISTNVEGGAAICDKANAMIDVLRVVGYHGNEQIEEAVRLAKSKEDYNVSRAKEWAAIHGPPGLAR